MRYRHALCLHFLKLGGNNTRCNANRFHITIMDLLDEKNLLVLELIRICSLYFFTVVVMCISVYVLIILVLKLFNQKPLQDSILEKLCKTVLQNELANCLRILEEHPYYINSFTRNGYTPFLLACSCGNTQMVKIMLKRGIHI